jgi:GNAT superfamily N-acetyltransferase
MNSLLIRPATSDDVPLILSFIRALAEYEELSDQVTATEELVRENLFGKNPVAHALLAFWDDQPAGFALFFQTFSTFLARPGIWLEDLFVHPPFRTRGIGRALLQRLAAVALERQCGRLEWSALDWNTLATDFYKKLGAIPMNEWTIYRMTGDAIVNLARTVS